ncbi:MAG: lipopolysaccharide biosynthesis protein [Clostridia bacterium]
MQIKNQLKAGVVLSYISTAVSIVIQLVYMPVMIRLLGQSEYGLYSLVSGVVSYLSLFSLGFSGAYMRFFAKSYNDREKTASLNGMFLTLFIVLALIATICGVVLSFFPKEIFGAKLSDSELSKARILMLILVVNIAISLINGILASIISAYEKFVFQRLIGLAATVVNPFVALPLLIMGYRSIMLVTVTTVITIVRLMVNIWFCLKKIKIPISFKRFEWGQLKEIALFSSFLFINMIIDQINWNVDKLILGHTNGTDEVAIYGVACQFNSLFMTFSTTISSVFAPRVNLIAAQKGDGYIKDYTNLMAKIGRIQWLILGLPTLGFIIFGKYFIVNIYAGNGYEDAYTVALFLILPAIIPLIQNVGIEMQRALNKHQFRSIIYLIMAILNIFISIPLANRFGAVGASAGTAIGLVTANILIMNVFYHKALKIDMKYFWKEIFKTFKGMIIPVIAAIVIMRCVPFKNMAVFFISICVFSVIYCTSVVALSCNNEEKRMLMDMARKVKRW